jgi:hypothetical protein
MRLSASIGKVAAVTATALTLAAPMTRAEEKVIPWEFPDFSATQVFQMANFGVPMKVYRAGTSVRMERSAAWSTLYTPYHIYNLTSYPDGSKQCVVMRPEQVKLLPSPLELLNGTKVHRTLEGTDVVEGHRCKVEKVVVTRPDGKTIESKVWEAEDLKGIPVKIQTSLPPHHYAVVYQDIVPGTPDKALFTPPEQCTPYEKMGQVVEKIRK